MQKFPWLRFTGLSLGLTGFGYLLMKFTVPTPEQTYAAMAPDLRRKVDAARAARLARESQTDRQATAQAASSTADPDNVKPIWAETPSQK